MPITKTETETLWKPGTSGSGSTRLNNASSIDATGVNSVAEGTDTLAAGDQSHAEGLNNKALGNQCHVEGTYNLALNEGGHVQGRGNMSFSGMSRASGNFSISGAVMNYFIFGPGGKCYDHTTKTMYVRGDLTAKVSIGDTIYWAHSDNLATYISTVAAAPVYTASGTNTVAVFLNYSGYTAIQITTDPTGGVDDTWAFEWGYLATDFVTNPADYWTDHACFTNGSNCYAIGGNATAEGYYSRATGTNSHAEGIATISSGFGSHSEGFGAVSSGQAAHAEGYGTAAQGASSHAEGNGSRASGTTSHAEGSSTLASGDVSHAEGSGTTASAGNAHSEGYNTTASASSSHAGGRNAIAYRWAEWARSNSDRGQYGIVSFSAASNGNGTFEFFLDESSSKFTIPTDTSYRISVDVIVTDVDTGDSKEWGGIGIIKNYSGTTSLTGAVTMTSTIGDASLAAATVSVTADDPGDYLKIQGAGVVGKDLNWLVKVTYTAVKIKV